MSENEEEIKEYTVVWTIDVSASNPVEAAHIARTIQQDTDPENMAHVYHVLPFGEVLLASDQVMVDLDEYDAKLFADQATEPYPHTLSIQGLDEQWEPDESECLAYHIQYANGCPVCHPERYPKTRPSYIGPDLVVVSSLVRRGG